MQRSRWKEYKAHPAIILSPTDIAFCLACEMFSKSLILEPFQDREWAQKTPKTEQTSESGEKPIYAGDKAWYSFR